MPVRLACVYISLKSTHYVYEIMIKLTQNRPWITGMMSEVCEGGREETFVGMGILGQ